MQKLTNSLIHKVSLVKQQQSKMSSVVTSEQNELNRIETSFKSVKQQANKAILQANINVSVDAGNEPLALLYKTAIEGINEVLEHEGLGSHAIQDAYESGLDITPKATAERIISMSTAFLSHYQRQHPEMTMEASVTAFTEIIRAGIDKGFAEAKEILNGLNVLEGDIVKNIDFTYELVQQGLRTFVVDYGMSDVRLD